MNDKTVMESPEKSDRNFSVVVPHTTYMNLMKIAAIMKDSFPGDRVSLGSVCRQLLGMVDHKLFEKLQAIARAQGVPVGALIRDALKSVANKQVK